LQHGYFKSIEIKVKLQNWGVDEKKALLPQGKSAFLKGK